METGQLTREASVRFELVWAGLVWLEPVPGSELGPARRALIAWVPTGSASAPEKRTAEFRTAVFRTAVPVGLQAVPVAGGSAAVPAAELVE